MVPFPSIYEYFSRMLDVKKSVAKLETETESAMNMSDAAVVVVDDIVKKTSKVKVKMQNLKKIPARKIMENTTASG